MQKICLALPTNRECATTIAALAEEAADAAVHFGVEVHLLILDSSDERTAAAHARAVRELPAVPGVVTHHLDEPRQRAFLQEAIHRSGATKPDHLLDLMLPRAVSYGACTNRAFLFAAALGCSSVHRRDSDSRYQFHDGRPVHPLRQELAFLGKPAADAAAGADRTVLVQADLAKPVSMVAASFIGEPSVDLGGIERRDQEVHRDIIGLWAPASWSGERRDALVDESFRGAGHTPFTGDDTLLTQVDPMRVDMCNISFHQGVYEALPLPPAVDTIGSDYFLIHAVHDATLPGVLHNRHIVNYYTPERRTPEGLLAYQLRYAKFLLSMLYFHEVYDRMADAGTALLDADHRIRADEVARLVRESSLLDRAENITRLEVLEQAYRRLGDPYTACADLLAARGPRLLDEAQADIEDFALLIEAWGPLVGASRATAVPRAAGGEGIPPC
ncbi:DUF6271 family protein [Streptomyces sp. NPDC000594]|uniref:DUF6271 family protein n=1 Tax=Streptomyces sp. NPDC000594 TaxID=3154261 RepID=UPI003329ED26